MAEVYSILYEDSQPARRRISYYNALAANAGFSIKWLGTSALTNGYGQLQSGEVDAVLISGREDFNELREKELKVVISKRHERRMVALFSPSIDPVYFSKQHSNNLPLTIAADFEWQAKMTANFLLRALPSRDAGYQFLGIGHDHVFEARLSALLDGRIDIAVFSLDDLNMATDSTFKSLRYMVLPLFDCPPGIFQATTGLIIKDKRDRDEKDLFGKALMLASDAESTGHYLEEAIFLIENTPRSCGVFSLKLSGQSFIYLGFPEQNGNGEIWKMDAALPPDKSLFSTTDFMKDFFRYEYLNDEILPGKPVYFIGSHKSIHSESLITQMAGHRVWAAGNKTWTELAKKGIWVEGSADGLGLESLASTWAGSFTRIDKADVNILTNAESATQWLLDGWAATGTYKLISSITPDIIEGLETAEIVFWTSYQQFQACRSFVKSDIMHASPAGKTSVLLRKDGIDNLVVFPSIKAFSWYREQVYSLRK